jgi:hypothetical protein
VSKLVLIACVIGVSQSNQIIGPGSPSIHPIDAYGSSGLFLVAFPRLTLFYILYQIVFKKYAQGIMSQAIPLLPTTLRDHFV